jgi:ATPase subunit of ABC transporter with duplicated ATPase domains
MTHITRLTLNHLSYAIPNTTIQFDDLNLSFEKSCYGMIGDNGVGKTTLLKLLSGILQPHSGNILVNGLVAYCPQHVEEVEQTSLVLQILGIQEKWQALQRLHEGEMLENDFEVINDDWALETDIASLFQRLELPIGILNNQFMTLSGGQKTKVLLAKMMLIKADFVLLDEPKNNLDSTSKQVLIEWIQESQTGFIIVSHDRDLLNTMDEIVEITNKGIHRFGGNYDLYETQKNLQQSSLQKQILDAEKELKQVSIATQTTREQHE